jgi:hypothetical protein
MHSCRLSISPPYSLRGVPRSDLRTGSYLSIFPPKLSPSRMMHKPLGRYAARMLGPVGYRIENPRVPGEYSKSTVEPYTIVID